MLGNRGLHADVLRQVLQARQMQLLHDAAVGFRQTLVARGLDDRPVEAQVFAVVALNVVLTAASCMALMESSSTASSALFFAAGNCAA